MRIHRTMRNIGNEHIISTPMKAVFAGVGVLLASMTARAQAPGAVTGNTVGLSIVTGTYPFASYGYGIFLPATTGNTYQLIGIYNVAGSTGTYTYSTNGANGTIGFLDSNTGSIETALTFTSPSSGSYTAEDATDSAYQIGDFTLFSGQVPYSMAGANIVCTVQDGLYPFATTGTFTFKAAATGDKYVIVGDKMHTASSSGTFASSQLNATTLLVQFTDPKLGSVDSYIAFSSSSSGVFASKSPSTGGFQIGSFIVANWTPFLSAKGTYNGLFYISNGVTEATAGMLKGLTLNQNGSYSGTLLINGASHGISGTFSSAGLAGNYIGRTAGQGGSLTMDMSLVSSTGSAPQIIGTVTGSTNGVQWTANLTAGLADKNLPSVWEAMLIPPNTNALSGSLPSGNGQASIIENAGTAKIAGLLADGTRFSESVAISQAASVPVYASLYAGKGLLLGWINLDSSETNGMSLTWIHPETRSGQYRAGFTNVLVGSQIQLSP